VNGDSSFRENFALGDLPADYYNLVIRNGSGTALFRDQIYVYPTARPGSRFTAVKSRSKRQGREAREKRNRRLEAKRPKKRRRCFALTDH
jgi:hypothetical protein